uniref:Putative secreted protein n=1 Tax=Anopheles darlingi TaxID=43151 RepID=A0A2M4DNA7_ANODA
MVLSNFLPLPSSLYLILSLSLRRTDGGKRSKGRGTRCVCWTRFGNGNGYGDGGGSDSGGGRPSNPSI